MKVKKICLYCGQPNDSINYTCSCKQEEWFDQYRVLDLLLENDESEKAQIIKSFHNYNFNDDQGMLQYKGIPFGRFLPEILEPVGNTPLYELNHLSSHYGCRLFLKSESQNPSGCFKDRETMVCLLNSIRRGLRKAVIFSSGNAAASAAIFAQKLNFHLITCVAGDTYPEKINFIQDHGSDVIVIGDDTINFETGFRLFAKINAEGYFAKNKYDNWSVRNPYRVQGDKTTSIEIIKQLSDGVLEVPEYIIVPTANGSCLSGIWKGFKEMKQLGIIDKLPKMVSAGIVNASPIYEMVKRKQTERPWRCDLSTVKEEDAQIGSIILAEEGYDSIEASKAVLESSGIAVQMHTSEIKKALQLLLEKEQEITMRNAILPEPASLTAIAAVNKLKKRLSLHKNDKVVSIMTGHGMKAVNMIQDLLLETPELLKVVEGIIEQKSNGMAEAARKKGRLMEVPAELQAVKNAFDNLNPNH